MKIIETRCARSNGAPQNKSGRDRIYKSGLGV